ncbi:toprim domain-containing protein [Kingella negevensis]|uniref:Uncharacterized protein n=1 Tax=Kingella negevensis TaxID=1522312 RepID=A0A238HDQ9_9NEIS|nr:toprim domain-containing protein [Kingella negevensis]MDK4696620.1 toprim domain-containing protein [Kingella negevensis]SNB53696.1 Uncharacterised protein [Kingella negevensis]
MQPKDPVYSYLQHRGIDTAAANFAPCNLRHCTALPYWTTDTHGKPLLIGYYSAMLGLLTDTEDQIRGIQRVYLQPEKGQWVKAKIKHPQTGEALDGKKMLSRFTGSTNGASVKLFDEEDGKPLIIAEDIETALAAHELFQLPAWAAISAGNMQRLELPQSVKSVLIVADHDTPRPIGYEAAHDLAVKLIKQGRQVQIWQPETQGYDALDELNRRKRPAYQVLKQNSLTS